MNSEHVEVLRRVADELRRADALARKSDKIDRRKVIGMAADNNLSVILSALASLSAQQPAAAGEMAELVGLLDEVRAHFTRDDDLPDDLLPRIDAALAQQPIADPLVEWANSPLNFTATVGEFKDGVQPTDVDGGAVQPFCRECGTRSTRHNPITVDLCARCAQRGTTPAPIGWVFQHDETGRMTFCENDGINTPDVFARLNPRHTLCGPAFTAPPSAPVGVEEPLSLLRAGNWREVYVGHRCMRLEVTYDYATWKRLMAEVEAALAQQPAADPLEEWANRPLNFTATVGKFEDDAVVQQPAAVDEVFRLLREYREAPKFSNDHNAIKRTVALEDEIDKFLTSPQGGDCHG